MSRGHLLILGWAGSSERQLHGVARFVRPLGLRPLVFVPRTFRAMAHPMGWRLEGRAVLGRLVDAFDREPGPIVVVAFSNAGFWAYAAALRALSKSRPDVLERIAALVLDSAPGFPPRIDARFAAHHSAMAMMPMLLGALGRPPAHSHALLDRPLRAFMRLWYASSPLQVRTLEGSLALVRDTGSWPVLALCSSADTLVPIELVEAFMGTLGERGRVVRFEGSEHVRHMIAHRRAYFAALADLVDAVLPER